MESFHNKYAYAIYLFLVKITDQLPTPDQFCLGCRLIAAFNNAATRNHAPTANTPISCTTHTSTNTKPQKSKKKKEGQRNRLIAFPSKRTFFFLSLLVTFSLDSTTTPVAIPTAALSAQALLIQIGPIPAGIIDGDLVASLYPLGHQDDALDAEPGELLELAVRVARMVDEARVVALAPLPDLVRPPVGLALHDVHVVQAAGDEPDELAYRHAPFEWLKKG